MLKSVISGLAIESGPEGLHSALSRSIERITMSHRKTGTFGDSGDVFSDSALKSPDGMFQIADNYPPGTILDDVTLE